MSDIRTEVYNIDIKEMFLDWIDLDKYPPRWWERVFEKSKIIEEKYQKDLSNFTTEQILEFYKYLDINSLESLMIYNINLIKYGNWALGESIIIDGQNHFCEVDNEKLVTCINELGVDKSIVDLQGLKKLMMKLPNYQDKFIFFCLFEGIKGKDFSDIYTLKMSNINGTTVTLKDRAVEVDGDFEAIASIADKETTYITTTQKIIKLMDSDYIVKEKFNSRGADPGRAIYATIVRGIKVADLSNTITASSLYNSGFIYYLNQLAEKENMSVETLMTEMEHREKVQPILDKYKFNINIRKRFFLKYGKHLKH